MVFASDQCFYLCNSFAYEIISAISIRKNRRSRERFSGKLDGNRFCVDGDEKADFSEHLKFTVNSFRILVLRFFN